jgi:hypothetical protein
VCTLVLLEVITRIQGATAADNHRMWQRTCLTVSVQLAFADPFACWI